MCVCVFGDDVRGADGEDGEGVREKKKRKMVKRSIVQELRNEYLDLPEEVNVSHMTSHTTDHMTRFTVFQDVGRGSRSHREVMEEREREE